MSRITPQIRALDQLRKIKNALRDRVSGYEENAQSCSSCRTPGACCLDEHFVNVRISRLEAAAVAQAIHDLPAIQRSAVTERINDASEDLIHSTSDLTEATFACPLYEKNTGCLVHNEAKPVPCMVHACYERREDLPPDELQDTAELAIDDLNHRVYGRATPLEPLPIAVQAAMLRARKSQAITSPAKNHPAT